MLTDEVIEKVIERLVNRIEQANEYVLKEIGRSIKQIGTFNPTKANQLVNVLKYGGDYNKIVNKLAKITNMNVRDIYTIFDEVAKSDYNFSKQFYEYRNKPFIPYAQNMALRSQVRALADITAKEYINLTKTSALGFGLVNDRGNIEFKGLQQTYYDLLDEAVLSVSQGKETFDSAMHRQLKNIGESGLKVIYNSTYVSKDGTIKNHTRRLDSAVSMNMKSALRNLHNETQKQIGEGFGADGVEISVHSNPAPDHQYAQGKQFSYEEFNKLQTDGTATTYDKKQVDMHLHSESFRLISEWNCYHYTFSIILGVNKPQYSNEELQKIINDNNKGFELDGKHYTNYEGTQMQRQLETAIRKQKDIQIMAEEAGDMDLVRESQQKITQLTKKYKELSDISGLPTKIDRMRVSGYKRTRVDISKDNDNIFNKISIGNKTYSYEHFKEFKPKTNGDLENIGKEYFNFASNESLDYYVTKTSNIKTRILNGDIELKNKLDELEPKIDTLATPSKISFKMFSAKDVNVDYSKDNHLLSGSISKTVANVHNKKNIQKETITIFVEEGADIISTYNTSNKHFNRQGEVILPTKRKLDRIDKYNYILKK